MKITFCGKGGCGKSTVTALLAKELASRGKRVLIIDCDESNYGLHQQLGMELPTTFVENFGGKQAVMGMLSGGPQNMPTLFDKKWSIDDIPDAYVTKKDGILLMSPGKIETANEACACPFNVIMTQFIPMLQESENDLVLMDMEAGIEHFGRGTDNATDMIVMVIDPSCESLKLSKKVGEIGRQIGKPVYYVLNKTTEGSAKVMRSSVDDPTKICCELRSDETLLSAGLLGTELRAGDPAICEMIDMLKIG